MSTYLATDAYNDHIMGKVKIQIEQMKKKLIKPIDFGKRKK